MDVQKTARTAAGTVVLIAGVIMIPYPGPGWLVVFIGLTILSRDHPWAARTLVYTRSKYDAWEAWVKRQPVIVRWLLGLATALLVVLTLWLLNVYGMLASWLHIDMQWLKSPFVR